MKDLFAKTEASCKELAERLNNAARKEEYEDTPVSVRVIGEFSAGKTRFLREIFGELLPEPLEPISSPQTETLLPLEITYGPEPKLELIRRKEDYDQAEHIRDFDRFPERNELTDMGTSDLRLRLYLPEDRLILPEGDGYYEGNEPKRLRIIDHPGWNSRDDARGWEELGLSSEWKNLGLVYVCSAIRCENQTNLNNLKMFLEALRNEELEPACAKTPLYFVITACEKENRLKMAQNLKKYASGLLDDAGDRFPLTVIALDFENISAQSLARLRESFWGHLALAGPAQGRTQPKTLLDSWPEEWELTQYLAKCARWLAKISELATRFKKDGKYLRGRNMRYYDGLKPPKLGEKAFQDWQHLAGSEVSEEAIMALAPPDLPPDHFLRIWLDAYWLPRLRAQRDQLLKFRRKLRDRLSGLRPETEDLEMWLGKSLDGALANIRVEDSFRRLISTMRTFPAQTPNAILVSTLLSFSLIEARYAEAAEEAR